MKNIRCVDYWPHDCSSSVTSEQEITRYQKRRKLDKKQETPLLPPEIFSIVIPFLYPREMFRLAFTCKYFSKMIHHEDVVRSAVMQGGHSKRNMDELFPAIRDKTIFIPSPLRLLRIANGRRCENPGCNKGIRQLRPQYGLFVCDRCYSGRRGGTIVVKPRQFSETDRQRVVQAAEHPRVLRICFGGEYSMWRSPFIDSSGERAGPLITWSEVGEQVYGKKKFVEDMLNTLPLSSDLEYESIVHAYDASCQQADIAANQRGLDWQSKQRNRISLRIRRAKAIVQKIAATLPEKSWKSFALNCTWGNARDLLVSNEPVVQFHCEFVNEYMEPLMKAPSTVTNKKITDVALSIQASFDTIYTNGVHDFSFLSNDLSDVFEPNLRKYLTKQYTPEKFLSSDLADGIFVSFVEKKENLKALTYVLGMSCLSVALVACSDKKQSIVRIMDFSKNVWLRHTLDDDCNSHIHDLSSELFKEMCKSVFQEVKIVYEHLRDQAIKYISHPKTSAFINSATGYEAGSPNDYSLKMFRMDQVQSVWTDYDCLDLLEASNFGDLLKFHEEKAVNEFTATL